MLQEVKIQQQQDLFDIALLAYNDASKVYDLILNNPDLDSLIVSNVGKTVTYEPIKIFKKSAVAIKQNINKVVTIKAEQTIFDLSLQHYGSVENVYNLIQDNSFLDSIINVEISGNTLNLSDFKNFVSSYYKKYNINVGTKPIGIIDTNEYLLQENGYKILQENGYKILL